MATHGCLKIIEKNKENIIIDQISLYTYHTGMDIPKTILKAFDVLANYYDFLKDPDKNRVERSIERSSICERLKYTPSAAALIIAASPCFLEPITPIMAKHLPNWRADKNPFVLEIIDNTWTLFDQSGDKIATYNIYEEIVNRLLIPILPA